MADTLSASLPTTPDKPARHARGPRSTTGTVLRVVAIVYVALLVLVPVAVLVIKTFEPGLATFFDAFSDPATQHAFQLTAIVAGISIVIDAVFGVTVAILLVRYRFPGRRLLSAFVDLPVAVSPIVVGLALILVFGPDGWFGSIFATSIIFSTPGMVLATVFVSLPLVARAIVPVLEQSGVEKEQAAASLGANAAQRFLRITLPTIRVALAYGVVLGLARCIGEYGAVLVVSGNLQGSTETAPLRIGNLLEFTLDSEPQAFAITFVLMLVSVVAILIGTLIRRYGRKA